MFMGICSILMGIFFWGLGVIFTVFRSESPDLLELLFMCVALFLLGLFFIKVGIKKCRGEALTPIERIEGLTPGTYENYGGTSLGDLNFGRDLQPGTVPKVEDPEKP